MQWQNNEVHGNCKGFGTVPVQKFCSNGPINIQQALYKSKFDALSIWTNQRDRCFKANEVFTTRNISFGESSTIRQTQFDFCLYSSFSCSWQRTREASKHLVKPRSQSSQASRETRQLNNHVQRNEKLREFWLHRAISFNLVTSCNIL